jgi:ABC-type Zn2+ transport system substrate-binding protein/surface adhesin
MDETDLHIWLNSEISRQFALIIKVIKVLLLAAAI